MAAELDNIIHQPARLRLMASLCALETGAELDFGHLRDLLQLTDGNLGAHIQKLEEAGYVQVVKVFVARKPRTFLSATPRGRAAFTQHVEALREICIPAG